MRRPIPAVAFAFLSLAACSDSPTGEGDPLPNPITIDGNNVGAAGGLVFISQGGQSISDASVTVTANGVAASPLSGGYYWELGAPLTVGATLTVRATRLGKTATLAGPLPSTPILSAPAVDGLVTIGTPLTVTWTSASNPAYFIVNLGYRVGNTGMGSVDSVAGSARTVSLATAGIPVGATLLSIDIRAYGTATLGGDVSPTSRLNLFASSEIRNLVLNAGQ